MISAQTRDPTDPGIATVGTGPDVLTAAGRFGMVLRASPEFQALVAADRAISADTEANVAIAAFGQRQAELRMESMLGTLTDPQRAELERLRTTMLAVPTVASYVAAEEAFRSLCRETAAVVSAQAGIDFAANCRSGGCCG